MIKSILGTMLIILAIVFIYPKEIIIASIIGEIIFMGDSDTNNIMIGDIKIENYDRLEILGEDGYNSECKAYYFDDEQAKKIKTQIENEKNWTEKPFNESIIDVYKKFNVNTLGKSYYFLKEYNREGFVIETNRDVLDNKNIKWFESAIYDSDNKVLYMYYIFYEK